MAAEDLLKRYLEVGAAMLGMSRERAEGIVRDFVASGEVAKEQATKAADWLVERGRTGTEELAELIRREVRQQVTAMGLATQTDIARLEARLDASATASAVPAGALGATPRAKKPASAAKRPGAGPAPDDPAPDDPLPDNPVPDKPAGAGITRSGSVRGRPGDLGAAPPPGAAPPAGVAGAVSPKD